MDDFDSIIAKNKLKFTKTYFNYDYELPKEEFVNAFFSYKNYAYPYNNLICLHLNSIHK